MRLERVYTYFLDFVIISFSFLDLGITIGGLYTGIGEEENPIAAWFISRDGIEGLIIFAIFMTCYFIYINHRIGYPKNIKWTIFISLIHIIGFISWARMTP